MFKAIKYQSICSLLIVLVMLGSCSKDKRLLYENDSRVYFYKFDGTYPDSIDYSFAFEDEIMTEDTIYLHFRIMGDAADHDRSISVIMEEGSTAKAGYHFDFAPLIIPANAFDAEIPVYLHRRPGLKDSLVTANLLIGESADFKPGYADQVSMNSDFTRLQYKFTITDKLTKPSTWDSYWVNYFGSYSDTKLRFLAQATNYITWNVPVYYPQDINFMVQSAKLALYNYEAENGPLIDEQGEKVTFP